MCRTLNIRFKKNTVDNAIVLAFFGFLECKCAYKFLTANKLLLTLPPWIKLIKSKNN